MKMSAAADDVVMDIKLTPEEQFEYAIVQHCKQQDREYPAKVVKGVIGGIAIGTAAIVFGCEMM